MIIIILIKYKIPVKRRSYKRFETQQNYNIIVSYTYKALYIFVFRKKYIYALLAFIFIQYYGIDL